MNAKVMLTIIEQGSAYLGIFIALIIGIIAASSVAYLLLLLCAASLSAAARRKQKPPSSVNLFTEDAELPFFSVVIPAHNEELVLAATLFSLKRQNYPEDRYQITVIADNCTDATARIASSYGVTVLTRFNEEQRGKGYALSWAFDSLLRRENDQTEAFAIVDADTEVSPDFLMQLATYIRSSSLGTRYALQGRYGVANHQDGWRAALMAGAFDLFNHVRPLGADRLGFLVGLKGNGMLFSRETLLAVSWGSSITEDIDFGLDLVRAGIPLRYVPEAIVRAQMPVTGQQAASQRQRWEMGRFQLLREKGLPLISEAIRQRNFSLFEAAVSLMVLPLAELVSLIILGTCIAAAVQRTAIPLLPIARGMDLIACALLITAGVGLLIYILYGLYVAGARKEAYVALLRAPFYAVWKILLYITAKRRPGKTANATSEWVRTDRIAISVVGEDRDVPGESTELLTDDARNSAQARTDFATSFAGSATETQQ